MEKYDVAWEEALRVAHGPKKKIETLYDYLDAVERRPSLFMGRELSLDRLSLVMPGRLPPAKFPVREKPGFWSFATWLDRKYPQFQGGGWTMVLARAAGGDGPEAVKLFFKELKEFKAAVNAKQKQRSQKPKELPKSKTKKRKD